MKKSKTDFFKKQPLSKHRASWRTGQPAANFPLTPRVCRRKRHFIFEDMPEITGLTPLNVMLLECGKKELYNWTLAQLWTYLNKIGYDLRIDALPREQDENTPSPNT